MERPLVKRWGIWILLLVAVAAGALWIWRVRSPHEPEYVTLYFLDKNGVFLVPVSRKVGNKGNLETAAREWANGPVDSASLFPPLPPDVSLLSVRRDGNIWRLVFSETLEGHLGRDAILLDHFRDTLLATLAPFAGPASIRVEVRNGETNRKVEDEEWEAFRPEAINVNEGESDPDLPAAAARERIRLYFLSKGTRYWVPVIREVEKSSNRLMKIAEEEIRGPRLTDLLEGRFPSEVRVVDVKEEKGTIMVILSDQFEDFLSRQPDRAREAIHGLGLALTEGATGKGVRVRVDAKGLTGLSRSLWHPPRALNPEEAVAR